LCFGHNVDERFSMVSCWSNGTLTTKMMTQGPAKKRTRRYNLEVYDASSNRVPADPKLSPWYLLYVTPTQGNLRTKKFHKQFRRRFSLTYLNFIELLQDLKNSGDFNRWLLKNPVGRPSSTLSIMLLGNLHHSDAAGHLMTWRRRH